MWVFVCLLSCCVFVGAEACGSPNVCTCRHRRITCNSIAFFPMFSNKRRQLTQAIDISNSSLLFIAPFLPSVWTSLKYLTLSHNEFLPCSFISTYLHGDGLNTTSGCTHTSVSLDVTTVRPLVNVNRDWTLYLLLLLPLPFIICAVAFVWVRYAGLKSKCVSNCGLCNL